MKRLPLYIGLFPLFFIGLVMVASASGSYPDNVEVYQLPSGHWCQLIDGQFAGCFCPCEEEIKYVCEPTPTPKDDPTSTPPPNPTDETPEPTKTNKESCNRGLGNGSEDCDPGNSGGNPGSAGEDNE